MESDLHETHDFGFCEFDDELEALQAEKEMQADGFHVDRWRDDHGRFCLEWFRSY